VGVLRIVVVVACATGCRQIFGIEPIHGDASPGGSGNDGQADSSDGTPHGDADLGACVASGKTITCSAADTYVSGSSQSSNYGADPTLLLNTTSQGLLPLVQFDLSRIQTMPTITSAQLVLFVISCSSTSTLDLYLISDAWTEGAASWNLRMPGVSWPGGVGPTYATPSFLSFTPTTGANTLTITPQVASWIANPLANNGFLVSSSGTAICSFASNDAGTAAQHPRLTVTTQ
jgi:hypothetical protein